MYILLTNDDGIEAAGLRQLADALIRAGHRVSVCAPAQQQSAASHSITLRRPLTVVPYDFPGAEIAYSVDGTPADCARMGVYLIRDADLVISGINDGANMGGACIYSGTVAAAMEASMAGRPALAVSLCRFGAEDFSAAAKTAVKTAEWMTRHPLPRGGIYNLNVPDLPYDQIKGVRAASLAPSYLEDPSYVVDDTSESVRYSYGSGSDAGRDLEGSDAALTAQGWASLTKLTWDLTMNAPDPETEDLVL